METVSLAISGMTCQIGCAKAIQSKLSKKEGVADVVVVFTDSIATITFDSNKKAAPIDWRCFFYCGFFMTAVLLDFLYVSVVDLDDYRYCFVQ